MRIAVVDDEESVTEFVCRAVAGARHSCTAFRTAGALLAELRRNTFDLVLLDWNLPDGSGIDLLRSIRDAVSCAPAVIMLTNRADKDDLTAALHAGADDYIVKPESANVIIARIEAVLRRTLPAEASSRLIRFDGYEFDRLKGSVLFREQSVSLSAKEFQLALTLFENMHRALSRTYLLETIWQSSGNLPTRTLDMHISRLRTKLGLIPENGYRIVAISGYGYRLERFGAEV
jgi:DNA-binding response OmpR family regulator